jgi:RNA polymerase sigma-70 factor (ECF subfamily)
MDEIKYSVSDRDSVWQEWASKAQKGDKVSYASLLRDISPYIRNVVTPTLSNLDWVDDVVQEVLLSVHKSLHTYDPKRSFKPWLYSIIIFRKTDFLRKYYSSRSNKSQELIDSNFSEENVTNFEFAGELKDIEDALSSIPEKQAALFTMMKVEGYTAKEVAQKMDMTESAVKVSVHRTMIKLKEILN